MAEEYASFVSAGLFSATDRSWIHPMRRSAFSELILVTSGELFLCENFSEYHLTPGDVLFLAAGQKQYGTRSSEQGVTLWRVSYEDRGSTGKRGSGLPGKVVHLEDYSRAASLCAQMEHDSMTPEYPGQVCDMLLRLLFIELSVYGSEGEPLAVSVCRYIRSHGGCVKVSDVAAYFEYNEDYITRVFKRIYAKGIKAYIDAVRIGKIKKLLADGSASVGEIAAQTGFDKTGALYSFFKYKTGMSPAAYRALYVGQEAEQGTDRETEPVTESVTEQDGKQDGEPNE